MEEISNPYKLNGQWVGKYTGTDSGAIHLNIDEDESEYIGVAYLFTDPKLPTVIAYFATPKTTGEFSFRTDKILAIDPATSQPVTWDSIKEKYPKDLTFADYADVRGSCDRKGLSLTWVTSIGVTGTCVLPRSKADQPSELVPLEQDWKTYKDFGIRLASDRPLFRGQSKPWRLRTPFHRSGRANMQRFVFRDIPTLSRHLSARMKHVFNLEDKNDFGAFINLIQHHGYPTPVLDWSYSPYVAAFFAFRGITNEQAAKAPPESKVRIFVFDSAAWTRYLEPVVQLIHPKLYVTVREFAGIENERMIPQQAASTVSSVDDIETHIRNKETDTRKYLQAIDLPMRERKQVIRELSYMGITAGSLFPGLDGVCQELKERYFEF
jgi:hypothetical protein